MERVAIIAAGLVANVVMVEPGAALPPGGQVLPQGSPVAPGWTYDGQEYAPPAAPPEPAPAVPVEVWTYQAKIVMALTPLESLGLDPAAFGLSAGASLYEGVQAAIASLPDQQRLVASIQLESAPGTRRDAPVLAALAEAVGLTDAMIDDLFIAAAALP